MNDDDVEFSGLTGVESDAASSGPGLLPHPARIYDYLLGGKDWFSADREAAEKMITHIPSAPMMARVNRDYLRRVVTHLVRDHGVTQFLDIGTGFPTTPSVHQVAQEFEPSARVVYVDRDDVVAAHCRALLRSRPPGRTGFIAADATHPDRILSDSVLSETLDLQRPVAVLLISFLMYFDDDTAHRTVSHLVKALVPGSRVAISHPTADFDGAAVAAAVAAAENAGVTYIPRSKAQVESLFTGLQLCEPGIVPMMTWRPDPGIVTCDPLSVYYWVGEARI